MSVANTNLNNAVTNATYWKGLAPLSSVVSVATTFSVTSAHANSFLELNSTSAAFNVQLPAPSTLKGQFVFLKDIAGLLSTNNVTLLQNASEKIENVAASYVLSANFGSWDLFSDGTNWFFS